MIRKIERASGPRFEVYAYRNGKKKFVGSYLSEREATNAEEDDRVTRRKIERGELPPQIDVRRTFGVAVDAWLKWLAEGKSRSHDEYSNRVENYLRKPFGNVPLVEIRKADVTAWRDELAGRVSAATVNTVLGALSSAFTFCIDERQWLEANPCVGVKRLKASGKVFPWLESTEAITRLLVECPDNIRSLVAVLVGTGIRLDEALHARWDDVDLEHRLLTVHRGRRGTTKSGKMRKVPLFDTALSVLKAMKLARGDSPLLWPGGDRRYRAKLAPRSLSQAAVRKPFKAAALRAGLPKELRIHDLRHTFASLFLVDGGDIFKLSRILGHHSVAITEKTYAHLKPSSFAEDYGRVRFAMPSSDNVISLRVA